MNSETTVELIGTADDLKDLQTRLAAESVPAQWGPQPASEGALPFSLDQLTVLVTALGSSGAIVAVARCVLAYLKERKKRIQIVSAGERIDLKAENYSEKELAAVLARLRTSRVIISREDTSR